eukprot:SAG11_NODE_26653_length_342_cov_1.267490_1_plen_32_part_10
MPTHAIMRASTITATTTTAQRQTASTLEHTKQ